MSAPGIPLAHLQEVLAERGHLLPVCVAHAVAVALLDRSSPSEASLDPREVSIDDAGVVHGPKADCAAVAELLEALLGGEAAWPARALPLRSHFAAIRDGQDADPDRLRRVLRRHLTAPAGPAELRQWAALAPLPDAERIEPSALPTLPPPPSEPALSPSLAALEENLDEEDRARETDLLPARPDSEPPAEALRSAAEVLDDIAAGELELSADNPDGAFSPSGRPVVRHELPRSDPPVTVASAPAARRSARASHSGADSLMGPPSDRSWAMWLAVLLALTAAMYLLFFG